MIKNLFDSITPTYKNDSVQILLTNMEALTELSSNIEEPKKKKGMKIPAFNFVGNTVTSLVTGLGAVGAYATQMDKTHAPIVPIKGTDKFNYIAPEYVKRLMKDFGLTKLQASAVVGNLGHESAGFTAMQEARPTSGRGGLGFAQWTGPRRRTFEALAKEQNLPIDSPELNYMMLKMELEGEYKGVIEKLKTSNDLKEAVYIFERGFERSADVNKQGVIVKQKSYQARYNYAGKALQSKEPKTPEQLKVEIEKEQFKKAKTKESKEDKPIIRKRTSFPMNTKRVVTIQAKTVTPRNSHNRQLD